MVDDAALVLDALGLGLAREVDWDRQRDLDVLADAFEVYDDALGTVYGEATPFYLAEEDEESEDEESDGEDEDDDLDEEIEDDWTGEDEPAAR